MFNSIDHNILATERRRDSRSSVSSSNAAAPPLGVVGTTFAPDARVLAKHA